MSELVTVGEFCPNPGCEKYGKVGGGNIIHYGKTGEGRQRFQCTCCRKTFNERKGTLFYNRKTPEADILECLALLAEGTRISSISRTKGIKEDTILAWLREAAEHAEVVEAVLLNDYRIGPSQIDGLWTYVGRKGKKTRSDNPMMTANIGGVP
jgi:transposase-like protein